MEAGAMRAGDRRGCHVISLSEYEAAVESSPQPEVIRVIKEWLRVLKRNQRKNVLTLCTACDGPVNGGDIGGFIIFEPRVLTCIGYTICLCSKCFAEDDTREGVMRWVEGAAAKAVASVRRGR